MAVTVKMTILWNVSPYSLVLMYVFFSLFITCLYRSARQYDVTSQKTVFTLQRHSNDADSLSCFHLYGEVTLTITLSGYIISSPCA